MITRVSLLALFASASLAQAAGEEKRIFNVFVDKKQAGTHQVVVAGSQDGSQTVTCQADVTVKVLLITYKYAFKGSETWKNGRLQQFSTTTNDDGKKHAVSAEVGKDGLDMTADGKHFLIKGDAWLTTYWKLPPEKLRGPNVLLVDADTGKLINAKMEKVGVEKITVLKQEVECLHYRLTGGVQVDLWFDGDDRLVRQESIEEGHRTLLELAHLLRESDRSPLVVSREAPSCHQIIERRNFIMANRPEIVQKLVEFLEADSDIHLDNLSEDLSLREGLGLDSVDLVGIIMRIEGYYRVRLSHAELEQVATVGNLLDLIEAKLAENAAAVASVPESKAA